MRWLPEFDKPLGEAKADAVYDKATALVTRWGKRHFLSHLYIKCIILPRQARDKHRESTQKRAVFCREFASGTHVTFNHTNNQGEAG